MKTLARAVALCATLSVAGQVCAQGVSITQSAGSTSVSESGPTADTYTIVLDTQPTALVEIVADPDTQVDFGFGAGTAVLLTFTTSDWDIPQTITVTGVDDAVVEGAHTSTTVHFATSTDVDYDGIAITDVIANVTDNDMSDVTIMESGGSTDVSEFGPTADSYTIVLSSRPAANVVITVDPDGETDLGLGPGAAVVLSFAPSGWDLPRNLIVTAVDDAAPEGPHSSTITHLVASADLDYDGLVVPDVVANIIDNDAAGVTVQETGGSTDVSEIGPSSDTYAVSLDRAPANDVTVNVTPDVQTDLGAGAGTAVAIVFTVGAWDVTRNVTVTAADDAVSEGPHTSTITHVATSADPDYDGIVIPNVLVSVADDDLVGISIVETGGSTDVNELGSTSDTYTLVLDSLPTGDVDIVVDPDGQTDVGGGVGNSITVTFTPANWSTPQTITVTANDDEIAEGAHSSTVTHSATSSDSRYDGLAVSSVAANIADDDTAGVAITESGGSTSISEVGPSSDTYTIALNSEPVADVTITVDPDAQTDLGAGIGAAIILTFTAADWDSPQTVTVTAVDDDVAEGAHTSIVVHGAASADSNYDGFPIGNVTGNITDNDTTGVTVTETGGTTSVDETGPGSDTYTFILDTEPTDDVIITVDPDAQTDVGAGAGAAIILTFTAGDWDVAQTASVTAVDDGVPEGPHTSTIAHSAASADLGYHGIAIADVVANVTDNDLPGVMITESGGSTDVSEAGAISDTYTVVLDSPPASNVTIAAVPDLEADLGAGPGTAINLSFDAGNWTIAQTVTVTAVEDDVAEGAHISTITHLATSLDPNYDGIVISDVTAGITDNDTAGVTLTESGGTTGVDETGATSDTYTVVLDSEPVADVAITVDPDAQTDLGGGPGAGIVLTLTAAVWDVAQTVTVTAVDDGAPEGPHNSTITHTVVSADPIYDSMAVADLIVDVADDDLPGVTITESAGSTDASEFGPSSDTYTVALDSQPTAGVTVTIDPDAQSDLGAGVGTSIALSFAVGNWNTPQIVTVTAVDDDVDEGAHNSTITHTAVSADSDYDGIAISDVSAIITDNDTAGVTIAESGGSTDVDETGPSSDTYTVVLESEPSAAVTITVDPDVETDLGGGPGAPIVLGFTAGDWNAPQIVTVTAVDDDVAEGAHISIVAHAAASGDINYQGIGIIGVTASVTDDDTAGVTIGESGGSTDVDETGPTSDPYTIVLNSEPTSDVTITIDPDAQTDLGSGADVAVALVFTAANWDTSQTVNVLGVDDDVVEGVHASTITHTAASGDANYAGIGIIDVTVNIADNDTAGVTIAESGGSTDVDETGPSSDTYTVVLESEPSAAVTITVDPDVETDLGGGPGAPIVLGFTAGDWNAPQIVTVTAVDDDVAEGAHISIVAHAAASGDINYQGIGIIGVTASVADDDTAGVTIGESGGSTDVDETGPTSDPYTIVLNSEPTSDVTITIDPDAQTDVGSGADVAVDLVFTAANWDTSQTVNVLAVDDGTPEGTHASTIAHWAASSDANYDGIAVNDVVANVKDRAGITVTESDGSTIVDEADPTADVYTIVLNSEPSADVTIFVDPDGQVDVGGGPATAVLLTFTAANWNTAQSVAVTAVDDAVVEGVHTSIIDHVVVSIDLTYHGIPVSDVTAVLSDNDSLPPSGGSSELRVFAQDRSLTTDEDTAIDITLSATGRLGLTPQYVVVLGPRNGTLIGDPPDLTYTPTPDFVGIDSFAFIVANEHFTSNLSTVSIEVLSVPDTPRGLAQEVLVDADETLDILLYGVDPDEGDTITFEITAAPTNGRLAGTPPQLTYSPDPGFVGTDALTYVVDDGARASAPVVVTIVVLEPLMANAGEDQRVHVGQSVSFDGSRSRIRTSGVTMSGQIGTQIILYAWDFDAKDGIDVEATGPRVEWVYDSPGDYQIVLSVLDTLGRQSQDAVVCTVLEEEDPLSLESEVIDSPTSSCGPQMCGVLGWASMFVMLASLKFLGARFRP